MSCGTLDCEYGRVHALSIVSHTQLEMVVVVTDFDFHLARLRMPERVPQSFSGDPVNFIAQDGMQITRPSLNRDAKCRRTGVGGVGCQFFSQGIEISGEVVGLNGRLA